MPLQPGYGQRENTVAQRLRTVTLKRRIIPCRQSKRWKSDIASSKIERMGCTFDVRQRSWSAREGVYL